METIYKTTITFPKREQAEKFAIDWSMYSKKGHTVGSGIKHVEVVVDSTEEDKEWIDRYVSNLNNITSN